MAEGKERPGVTKSRRGNPKWSDDHIRAVRYAWVTSEYSSDDTLAEAFGMSRPHTIMEWRRDKKPDGQDWFVMRAEYAALALQQTRDRMAALAEEEAAKNFERELEVMNTFMDAGIRISLAEREKVTVPQIDPETGETVDVEVLGMKYRPKTAAQLAYALRELIKLRALRMGEPTERVEVVGEVIAKYQAAHRRVLVRLERRFGPEVVRAVREEFGRALDEAVEGTAEDAS